jgi:hypothetical protein
MFLAWFVSIQKMATFHDLLVGTKQKVLPRLENRASGMKKSLTGKNREASA